jgi:glycosyltransferase involved in cell wall biosynthesis
MSYPNTSVVVPVFNASATLQNLSSRVGTTLKKYCNAFELIFVDDGSSDNSWQLICELAQQYAWVRGVKLSHNMGQYPATLVGLRMARFPVSVTMDDDLQHPPEAIPTLLKALSADVDVVYALPHTAVQSPLYRSAVLLTKFAIGFLSSAPHLRYVRSFRAMRTSLYPWSRVVICRHSTPDGLLKEAAPRVAIIPVDYALRQSGKSNYSLRRSALLALYIWKSTRNTAPASADTPAPIAEITAEHIYK